MKASLLKYVFFFLLLALCSCGEGADSLSELSGKVFKALKAQDQSKLASCEPSVDEMEKAIEMYLEDSMRTTDARRDAAINKTASLKISIDLDYATLMGKSKERGIDWKNAKLKDFSYAIHEEVADYKDAVVKLVVQSGTSVSTLSFKAYLFGNRWYLIERSCMD